MGNIEQVKAFQKNTAKRFKELKELKIARIALRHYAVSLIPLLPLEDGGKSRGVFVGVLKTLGINIPDGVIRKKRNVVGEFKEAAFSEGRKKGMGMSVKLEDVIIPIHYGKADRFKLVKILVDSKALKVAITGRILATVRGKK